ncbi:hypothetical protein GCM10023328_13920 [Modestobacter marinus]|uniref:Putative ATPase n=1 Tax=Modestobacter marinus TaxID=477641 RepID=A0A846LLU5_9ACTN|nr:hypothetical protein [Modestobacter marinus]NIH68973.1 putative ATPase [Modestobacter marinus]GGL78539.1 hypothetical protein GCM10011589_38260 [Modestobacter marinus]
MAPRQVVHSSLVGRDDDVRRVRALLTGHRLVTVVGPGGVGKTRVASAVAEEGGGLPVSLCELAAVADPAGVPAAVTEALGFGSLSGAALGLADAERLVLLDNAEHHLDAVADVAQALLTEVPGLRLLVTSQVPLGLPGERVTVLAPLPVPDGDDPVAALASPAVQLFAARAREAGADLVLDDPTAVCVAALCRRLDGLPLAIELAAARSRTLGPADMLRHLDARFQLLTSARGHRPDRQQSLESAIGWSHARLDPAVQRFFARLGTFRGPFSDEAAHAVAADDGDTLATSLTRLDALVTPSLLTTASRLGRTWYSLPESLRLFARDRLSEAGELELCEERAVRRHTADAEQIVRLSQRSWPGELFAALLSTQLNLQEGIRWCLGHDADADRAFSLFIPLWGVVHNARAETVLALGDQLLDRWDDPALPLWCEVVATTATAAIVTGDLARGRGLAERVLDSAGPGDSPRRLGEAMATRALHMVRRADGEWAAALSIVERGIDAAYGGGWVACAHELEIIRALATSRVRGRAAGLEVAREVQRGLTDADGPILGVFAVVTCAGLMDTSDPAGTVTLFSAALDQASSAGYPWGVGTAHRGLAAVALGQGDLAGAAAHLTRSLDVFVALGHDAEVATTLRWAAATLSTAGRASAAEVAQAAVPPGMSELPALEELLLEPLPAAVRPLSAAGLRAALAVARPGLADLAGATGGSGPAPAAGPPDERPRTGSRTPRPGPGTWSREGPLWVITFAGRTVRTPDAKGLADLAVLVGRPNVEVSAAELMGAAVESPDLGPMIDETAKAQYRRRVADLQDDVLEAEDLGDLGRAEQARLELDQLLAELASSTGLGGRTRRAGAVDERARSAVTWRIRDAIKRLAQVHPSLGDHLRTTVRTGRWCAYEPADEVHWEVLGR